MKILQVRPKTCLRLKVFLVIIVVLVLISFIHREILEHIKTDNHQTQPKAQIQLDTQQTQPTAQIQPEIQQTQSKAQIQPDIQKTQPKAQIKQEKKQAQSAAVALGNMCTQSKLTLKLRAKQLAKRGESTNAAVNPEVDKYNLAVYPVNGTGIAVDISEKFDADVFNSFCESNTTLRAVLAVYSSVDRFETRKILRKTLGEWAKKQNCKMFFITGVSLNQTVNRLIQKEYVQEKDILMMPKVDAYRDLNDKAVAMIDWISRYCMHVPYVIHLIDDAYINLEMFLGRLESIKDDHYMLGGYVPNFRQGSFKTSYLIGFAYAFPTSIVNRLLSVVNTARYCWIEDVWLTGKVRESAGVKVIPLKVMKQWLGNQHKPFGKRLDGLPPYYFIHSVESEQFPKLYSSVIN